MLSTSCTVAIDAVEIAGIRTWPTTAAGGFVAPLGANHKPQQTRPTVRVWAPHLHIGRILRLSVAALYHSRRCRADMQPPGYWFLYPVQRHCARVAYHAHIRKPPRRSQPGTAAFSIDVSCWDRRLPYSCCGCFALASWPVSKSRQTTVPFDG
jgi:hypothetical protein